MASKKKVTVSFPGEVLVVRERDGDTTYLVTYESLEDVPEDAALVATYRFVKAGRLVVRREIV